MKSQLKKIDRLFCDDRKEYQLLREQSSLFQKEELSKIFMIAMALGFKNGQRVPLKKGKDDIIRIAYLKEEQLTMIKALAIMEKGEFSVLLDDQEIYSIAEEFANGGIKLLKTLVINKEPGSYIKKLSSELLDIIDKNK